MLKNYLLTALQVLARNKLYTLINIAGLASGIAAFILIIQFVSHETSFDRHWQDADRIFLMVQEFSFPPGAEPRKLTDFSSMFGPDAIDSYFEQEIELSAMILPEGERLRVGDVTYEGGARRADKSVLEMFQFETLAGSLDETFNDPNNIALSETEATRLFGNDDPLGKLLTTEREIFGPPGQERRTETTDFRVTAVFRMAPGNSVLNIPTLALLEERPVPPPEGLFIRLGGLQFFVKLAQGVTPENMNESLRSFVEQNATQFIRNQTAEGSPLDMVRLTVEPLNGLYFDPLPGLDSQGKGNRDAVRIYSAISALVLVIGCINFVILSTAKSTQRAREVAVRKVLGATPHQLVRQFLGESLMLTAMALALALGMVELLLPFLGGFLNIVMDMPYSSVETWLLIMAILAGVAFLGGLYPALVLSRFTPEKALRSNRADLSGGSIRLRSVLVVFQFAISISLVVATLIVYAQLAFLKLDPGYNANNLLVFRTRMGISINNGEVSYQGLANMDAMKQQILALPIATDVGYTGSKPNEAMGFFTELRTTGSDGRDPMSAQMPVNNVGYDFFTTFQIPLVAGRGFSRDRDQEMPPTGPFGRGPDAPPLDFRMILNQSAVRALGFASPEAALGQTLSVGNNMRGEIIGVAGDTRYMDIKQEPRAEAFQLNPALSMLMAVRFQGDRQAINESVTGLWSQMAGDYPYNGSFMDEEIDQAFTEEENLGRVFMLLSSLGVLISAMGLYGMASFTVDRRIKEIGIRKVLGANVRQIILLLLGQFCQPVLLSCLIAWPAVVYFISSWLAQFPLQIAFGSQAGYCLLAGIMALVVACMTVYGNTWRVASSNPVDALRYE